MLEPNTAPAPAKSQRWLRIAILVIGSTTFLCFLALSPILRSLTKVDRASGRPQTGVVTVEQIIPPTVEENVKPTPAQVWVRVNGSLVEAVTVFGSGQLRVGGQAQIVYRVGKSGRIYVDSVQPLPEPRSSAPAK